MAIDSAIENLNAVRLREEKNSARQGRAERPEKQTGSLRQRIAMARNLKERTREAAKEKVKSAVTSPIKQGTNELLKQSWLNLVDSFGLTLIYINMHVFLRWIFPSMFCKLGDEWMPRQVSVINSEANQAAGVSRFLGIAEVIGLLMLDLLLIIVLIVAISSIMMIIDKVYGVIGWLFDWFSQAEPNIAV